jgi:Leucine-rich repeat (LRR) protein
MSAFGHLARLRDIQALDLSRNRLVEVAKHGWAQLANLEHLTSLNVDSVGIGPQSSSLLGISTLTQLVHLNLSHNKIEDDGAKYLRSLWRLERLGIRGSNLSRRGVQVLCSCAGTGTCFVVAGFNGITSA